MAERKATRLLGQTKVELLGSRTVEILRDNGILFNSITPGTWSPGQDYRAERDQVFEIDGNSVAVGSTVKYFRTHDQGDSSRGIPRRQILPDEEKVPDLWWDRWLAVGIDAVVPFMMRRFQA